MQGSVLPVGRAQGIGTLLVTAMVQGAAAYVQTAEFEADLAATGRREAYVGKVGTLRGHRGKGLATALLGHALHAYREAGYQDDGRRTSQRGRGQYLSPRVTSP